MFIGEARMVTDRARMTGVLNTLAIVLVGAG
jgi:hypothetical protein